MKTPLLRIKPRKATGPDNIPCWFLKDCAEVLKDILTHIFNIKLSSCPLVFQGHHNNSSPEEAASSHNDYWPIACNAKFSCHHLDLKAGPRMPVECSFRGHLLEIPVETCGDSGLREEVYEFIF